MSHRKISAALSTHLAAMPTLPSVAWENAPFTPVSGTVYLKEYYLPATTTGIGVADDSSSQFIGVYQVSIHANSGDYKLEAQTLADNITAHFARGTMLDYEDQKVRIEVSSIANALQEGDRYMIPVSINWRSFA